MAKKVSKNQRTARGKGGAVRMAKVVVAQKKENGQYTFKQRMVPLDAVRQEAQALARA